jgi:hypothetical protein
MGWLPGFGHSISQRSLDKVPSSSDNHTAAVSSYDCTFDDLELVHQSLRTLEPPHTHKFPRVNAQKIRPHSTLGREKFLKAGPRAGVLMLNHRSAYLSTAAELLHCSELTLCADIVAKVPNCLAPIFLL